MSATPSMAASPIKFGTSGWRGLIADDFTFANVRLAVTAIAEQVKAKTAKPTILVGYDTRFYSEEFSALAVTILRQHGIRALLCDTFTPTPAIAYEIQRAKLDGAINFTASHNPAQYHGLKFSSSDAGPALPEITKDVEARAAKLFAAGGIAPVKSDTSGAEKTNLQGNYVKRLGELVRFDVLAEAKTKFAVDALHEIGDGGEPVAPGGERRGGVDARALRPADQRARLGHPRRQQRALRGIVAQGVAHGFPRHARHRRGVVAIADLDVARHAHAEQRMRTVDAEVGDTVAERVATLVALVGRRLDRDVVREQPLPRQLCRRQVGELPRLRDRDAVGVARLVLDGVARARRGVADGARRRPHGASCSMLRGIACEKNLSETASEVA